MRRLFTLCITCVSLVAMLAVGGCSYDDTRIWESIDDLKERVSALETVLNAYENNLFIESVEQIENGYIITFSDGSKATITNGKDGVDGADGKDGVDGADGKDGIDGADGKDGVDGEDGKDGADGKDGDTYIEEIIVGTDEVTFVLTDGTSFSIPLRAALDILFDRTDVACYAGASIEIGYSVVGGDEKTTVESFGDGGWRTRVTPIDATRGTIKITAPESGGDGKVVVLATTGAGLTSMKSIIFDEGVLRNIMERYEVGWEASTLVVTLKTNLDYTVNIPEEAKAWLSLAATRAEIREEALTFSIAENGADEPARVATVELIGELGDRLQSFEIVQRLQPVNNPIEFADEVVKQACVAKYDANGDGELSHKEAAAVEILCGDGQQSLFGAEADKVTSFDELQYFVNLKQIGSYAFAGCASLKSIELPATIIEVGDAAFMNCSSLNALYIKAKTPPVLGADVLVGNAPELKIYVRKSVVEAYKGAAGWSDYAASIEGFVFGDGNDDVVEPEKPKAYKLLTDISKLNAGDEILFCTKSEESQTAKLLSTTSDGSSLKFTSSVTVSAGLEISAEALPSDAAILAVEAGATPGTLALKDANVGYLYGSYDAENWSSKLGFKASVDREAEWNISLSSSYAVTACAYYTDTDFRYLNNYYGTKFNFATSQSTYYYYIYYVDGASSDEGGDEPTVTPLATPVVAASAEGDVVTVSWGAVAGAKDYTVTCGTATTTVSATTATFEGVEAGDYVVSVVANPADATLNTASEAGTATVTIEAPMSEPKSIEIEFPVEGAVSGDSVGTIYSGDVIISSTGSWRTDKVDGRDCIYIGRSTSHELRIEAQNGKTITSVTLEAPVGYVVDLKWKEYDGFTSGSYSDVWTGECKSRIVFTAAGGSHSNIAKIVVEYR